MVSSLLEISFLLVAFMSLNDVFVVNAQCGEVRCARFCESGYVLDENGCETCSCKQQSEPFSLTGGAATSLLGGVTCANVRCSSGTRCEMRPVQCVTTPCTLQQPECVPDDEVPTLTCANVLCAQGTTCRMVQVQCITTPCHPQPQCLPNEDQPPTCANVRCGSGTTCQLVQVQCFTTPCHPQPQCVAVEDQPLTCANIYCGSGTTCQLVQVQCFTTPCHPQPQCVAVQEPPSCASVTCGPGTKCDLVQNSFCLRSPCNPSPVCVAVTSDKCPPVCEIFCPHGHVLDARGCATCQCKQRECPLLRCSVPCPGGLYAKDKDGCQTCECLSSSVTTNASGRKVNDCRFCTSTEYCEKREKLVQVGGTSSGTASSCTYLQRLFNRCTDGGGRLSATRLRTTTTNHCCSRTLMSTCPSHCLKPDFTTGCLVCDIRCVPIGRR